MIWRSRTKLELVKADNDDIPVGRVLSRRELINLFGAAGIGLLSGFGGTKVRGEEIGIPTSIIVTPEETEGPFFVDENLNRSDLIAGVTRPSVLNGVPLNLQFKVNQISGNRVTSLKGAHVDVWHADTLGVYSDEPGGGMQREDTSGQKWLRGYQVTDDAGVANFNTIYPGWYLGRTVHIHFKIRLYSATGRCTYEFNSQLFFPDKISDTVFAEAPYNAHGVRQVRNWNDDIYNSEALDGSTSGSHLRLALTKDGKGKGYTGQFTVGLQID